MSFGRAQCLLCPLCLLSSGTRTGRPLQPRSRLRAVSPSREDSRGLPKRRKGLAAMLTARGFWQRRKGLAAMCARAPFSMRRTVRICARTPSSRAPDVTTLPSRSDARGTKRPAAGGAVVALQKCRSTWVCCTSLCYLNTPSMAQLTHSRRRACVYHPKRVQAPHTYHQRRSGRLG